MSSSVGALGESVLKDNKHQDTGLGSTENAFTLGPEMCGSFGINLIVFIIKPNCNF